jgi:hypothetical protein
MADVKFNAGELMESLTITISMPKAFGLRMWVVGRLIRLVAFVSPVKIEAKLVDTDDA